MAVSERRVVSGATYRAGVVDATVVTATAGFWEDGLPVAATCEARALELGSHANAANEANSMLRMWGR